MKMSSVQVALLSMALVSGIASGQETFTPTPQQAASIAYICKGWRPIAKEIYAMKTAGQPKPKSNSPLHARIVEEIFYARSTITSEAMAEALGEQLCVPTIKEKFRKGEMRIKS
jgi:hypothetical protein